MKFALKLASLASLLALFTACSTPESQQEAQQNYRERLASRCDGYGFQRGTTAFAQCMQNADAQANQEDQQAQQQQQYWFGRAQCHFSGRMDCP